MDFHTPFSSDNLQQQRKKIEEGKRRERSSFPLLVSLPLLFLTCFLHFMLRVLIKDHKMGRFQRTKTSARFQQFVLHSIYLNQLQNVRLSDGWVLVAVFIPTFHLFPSKFSIFLLLYQTANCTKHPKLQKPLIGISGTSISTVHSFSWVKPQFQFQ